LAFIALTVKVYAVPFVKPAIVHDLVGAFTVQVNSPGLDVTSYLRMSEPPVLVGVKKETVAAASLAATVIFVGGLGTVEGVTALDALDAADVPIPFVALTLNVYGEPFVNPVTLQVSVDAFVVHVPCALLFES